MRCFICLPLLLAACAATPYQLVNVNGYGYVDQETATDACDVVFVANSAPSLQQTQDFALFRAAQIGAAAGYRYLSVKKDRSSTIMVGSGHSGGIYAPVGRSRFDPGFRYGDERDGQLRRRLWQPAHGFERWRHAGLRSGTVGAFLEGWG